MGSPARPGPEALGTRPASNQSRKDSLLQVRSKHTRKKSQDEVLGSWNKYVNFGEEKGSGSARSVPLVDAEPQGLPSAGSASQRRGNSLQGFKDFYLKARPESGLDCLTCAIFEPQGLPSAGPPSSTRSSSCQSPLGFPVLSSSLLLSRLVE